MTSKLKQTLAIAALLTGVSGAAHATEGWYGRADVGWSWDGESEFTENGGTGAFTLNQEHDWTQHLGMGYAFSNGFRLEGELGHRFNQFDPETIGFETLSGDTHAWSAMANLFYDFNRGGRLEPYVGVGVGAARLNTQVDSTAGPTRIDDEDTVLAYQGLVGFAVGLGEQWDLDIGYRYFIAEGAELALVPPSGTTWDQDYEHQALTVGLRYQFAAPVAPPPPPPPPAPPPPPPPPVAAACPTGNHVVYFEWDRSNLNTVALEVIDAAVAQARRCNVSGVVVVGNTDTSGSPTYNQGLSERRASVVRDALVARGIAAGSIRTEARGETNLARPTRDGVREPDNRRSNITITFR